nr:PREDICTED: MAP7 domain-containing protein 2-like isoform X2 [Bemisia tabaci]
MFSELCRDTLRRAVASSWHNVNFHDWSSCEGAHSHGPLYPELLQAGPHGIPASPKNSAGATPVDGRANEKPESSSIDNSSNSHPRNTTSALSTSSKTGARESVNATCLQRDREERLKILREKQNEERQRKLEELKQQALAAQKFREQKEEERRRRMEELRMRDSDKRHQVEERKRLIFEAERERKEAILRKNQEREARIETKRRHDRSSIVFAFGSSTPRMLEPADTGGSYWASRRATSTSNVMMAASITPGPLTRRSSERELADGTSKKRATSASGLLNRNNPLQCASMEGSEDAPGSTSSQNSVLSRAARRKTDLMPTIPSSSPSHSRPSSAMRRTPGRAFSMSRLDILATPRQPQLPKQRHSQPLPQQKPLSENSMSRSMSHLAVKSNLRRNDTHRSMTQLGPIPPPRPTRAERLRRRAREAASNSPASGQGVKSGDVTPTTSRPASALSQHSSSSSVRMRPVAAPRRPRPISIAVTGVSTDPLSAKTSPNVAKPPYTPGIDKPPIPRSNSTHKKLSSKTDVTKKSNEKLIKSAKSSGANTPKATPLQSPGIETRVTNISSEPTEAVTATSPELTTVISKSAVPTVVDVQYNPPTSDVVPPVEAFENIKIESEGIENNSGAASDLAECDMSASMTVKRITTEEEAKAALAERRRLAREQAEREAELERQRLEAERLAEEERLKREEEEQRRAEEEQNRLAELARKAEEERLAAAIEEAKKREEEEKKRKEEEQRQKLEREEAERKMKEELERQRKEMEERLKKEEEDRQARRKRVEAIMLRTRGKSMTSSMTSTKDEGEEDEECNGNREPLENTNSILASNNPFNVSAQNEQNRTNGHKNGYSTTVQQNNTSNILIDLDPSATSNTTVPRTQIIDLGGKIPNEDSINFTHNDGDLLS